jgi:uncharacterized protein YegP (UPF0339 family)
MKLEVYLNRAGRWQVRIVARNGERWLGGQPYASKSNALRAARRMAKVAAEGVEIVVAD